MLTLAHGCSCDVCAEEYGPQRQPHSIPCGHVLCISCCTNIIDKTSSRQVPSCPFCRVQFAADQIRLIRMDFTTSGWSTPRRFPHVEASPITSDLLARRTERLLSQATDGMSRARLDARRLEDKVAKIAQKKCSVEEVSALHKELEDWLLAEKDDQTSSLYLSAALLRAILLNHMAHSEASQKAKSTENALKTKIDHLEAANEEMADDLRRQRSLYHAKSQECQQLRSEVSQLKALATTLGVKPADLPPSTPHLPTPPPSTSTSPTPYSTSSASAAAAAAAQTPVSRFHSRSASMSSGSPSSPRPSTPASSASASASRSHTPASSPSSPTRAYTPSVPTRTSSASAAAMRPATPAHGLRTYTPGPTAPPVPSLPQRYAATPSPMSPSRHTSSASSGYVPAPLVPPKPRRLSQSQSVGAAPMKLGRTMSEEKADAMHERWLPPDLVVDDREKHEIYAGKDGRTTPVQSARPASRMQGFSSAAYAAARMRDLGAGRV